MTTIQATTRTITLRQAKHGNIAMSDQHGDNATSGPQVETMEEVSTVHWDNEVSGQYGAGNTSASAKQSMVRAAIL